MNNDLISVIVPIYNVDQYLEECIRSICNQTYSYLEIILIDDGSTDRCGTICDEYKAKDNRIKVVHKKNGGLSDARNYGLNIANGEYIGFVDSDDFIEPDMYKRLYDTCIQYGVGISTVRYDEVTTDSSKIVDADNSVKILKSEKYIANIVTYNKEEISTYSVCTRLYHKSTILKQRFSVGRNFEDVFFSLAVLSNTDYVGYINEVDYHYRIRDGSITNTAHSEILDKRIVTDLIPEQELAIDYMSFNCDKTIVNIVKASFFEDTLYYCAINPYGEYNEIIVGALLKFKLSFRECMRLPYRNKRVKVGLKMLFMREIIQYFKLIKR